MTSDILLKIMMLNYFCSRSRTNILLQFLFLLFFHYCENVQTSTGRKNVRFRLGAAFAFLYSAIWRKTSLHLQHFKHNTRPHYFNHPSSHKQYRFFLKPKQAKNCLCHRVQLHIGEFYVHFWDAPLAPKQRSFSCLKEICQFCASISYFAGVTLLGIYYNLMRRRFKNSVAGFHTLVQNIKILVQR